jgi:hypothetical protein
MVTEFRGLVADTPEAEIVAAAMKRCEELRKVFAELTAIDQEIASLAQRDQVAAVEGRVGEIVSRHAAILCPQQEAIIRQRTTRLTERVATLEEEASNWLEDCRNRAEDTKRLSRLIWELREPPAFLPASKIGELDALVADVQRKLDEDSYGQVVRFFKKITDKDERRRLLEELQTMVDAE